MYSSPEVIGSLNETPQWLQKFGLVAGMGGLAITAAVAADGWLGRRYWGHTENYFTGINPATEEQSLSMGGLGITCSKSLADDAQKFIPGATGHVTYSNKGFSIDQLGEKFRQEADGLKLLHLYLHSMGGPVGLETMRAAEVKNMKLGKIVLNCSPYDNDDAYLGRYTSVLEAIRWPVGPASKLLFSFTRSTLEGKPHTSAWQQAKYDAVNGCSPRLFLSQLSLLRHIRLTAIQEEYKSLIGPETKAIYCRPQDPLADIIVNTPQASDKFANFFDRLGVPFEDVLIPNVGHAQSDLTADFLASRTT